MKKTFKTFALIMMCGALATACQKENIILTTGTTVNYTISNSVSQATLTNDESWNVFMDYMLALAREGYEITIFNGDQPTGNMAKDKVTFTTTSSEEATQWGKTMLQQGYSVTISYDKKTGIYTCTAVK